MICHLYSFRLIHQLEYDHGANENLELLSTGGHEDEDLFTFNAHEIYITEPEYEDLDPNYEDPSQNFDERSESVGNNHDGFGVDDLFNPKRADRDSSYDQVRSITTNQKKHYSVCERTYVVVSQHSTYQSNEFHFGMIISVLNFLSLNFQLLHIHPTVRISEKFSIK